MSNITLTPEELANNDLIKAKINQREMEILPLIADAVAKENAKNKATAEYDVSYKKYLDFFKGTLELKKLVK
jgi:hypothetical protein